MKGKQPCIPYRVAPPVKPYRRTNPWPKPPEGWVALSVDGSYDEGKGGTGMVLRDTNGEVIFAAHSVMELQ
jgi:hypothetical protein